MRQVLLLLSLCLIIVSSWLASPVAIAQTLPKPTVKVTESELKAGDELTKKAFNATNIGDFTTAERYWSQLIELFPQNPAIWSNRGNSRVSQNKLEAAILDYNRSIELAPNVTDPYLNRGTALEGLGKWNEAILDYNRVLEIDPKDAMAYNNRGNAKAGLEKWEEAIADYQKCSEMAPNFAFARANYALSLYQIGERDKAIKTLRNLTRKYAQFPDVRAALTAALWTTGQQGEAESNWVAVMGLDGRYKDINWVKNIRRWPPSMVVALQKFLDVK
jgi:tetratricopeptide (TPR) repeat protein